MEWTEITCSTFTNVFLICFFMYRILNGAQDEPKWATLWATRRHWRQQGDEEEGRVKYGNLTEYKNCSNILKFTQRKPKLVNIAYQNQTKLIFLYTFFHVTCGRRGKKEEDEEATGTLILSYAQPKEPALISRWPSEITNRSRIILYPMLSQKSQL